MDRVRESVREGVRDTRQLVMADSNSGSHRMLTLLVLLVGLVSLANLIVVSVILNKPTMPDVYLSPTINTMSNPLADGISKMLEQTIANATASGAIPGANKGRRRRSINMAYDTDVTDVFLVQYGKMVAAQQPGVDVHDGYIPKLITEVCLSVGVVCLPVYDEDENCILENNGEHPMGGKGLLGGWYDGCVGWERTAEREHVFGFSQTSAPQSLMARKDSELLNIWDQGIKALKEGNKLNKPCKKGDALCGRGSAEEL